MGEVTQINIFLGEHAYLDKQSVQACPDPDAGHAMYRKSRDECDSQAQNYSTIGPNTSKMKKKIMKYIQLDYRKLNPNHTIKLGLSSIIQTFDFVQVITPGYFLLILITS